MSDGRIDLIWNFMNRMDARVKCLEDNAERADYIEHALGLLGVGPYKAACLWPEVVGLKSDAEIAAMSRGE